MDLDQSFRELRPASFLSIMGLTVIKFFGHVSLELSEIHMPTQVSIGRAVRRGLLYD